LVSKSPVDGLEMRGARSATRCLNPGRHFFKITR
jgi:hypothetical protein